MADELEKPSFGSFGIESTMEMGNAELLEGLMAPETSTTDPDKIERIPKEEPKKEVKKAVVKQPAKEEVKDDEPKQKTLEEQLTEEDEEEEEEIEVEKKEEEEEDKEFNPFSAFSKELFKQGVFTKEEDEEEVDISTPEEFLERFHNEKKKGVVQEINNFLGNFGDDYKDAFTAIYVNGVNPKEYFTTYSNIENIVDMDLTVEDNQEAIVRQGLRDQGLDQAKISAKLEKIKNYGDLEDEAKTYHEILVKKETAKLAKLEQDSQQALQQKALVKQGYAKTVNTVLQEKLKTKDFDGIPLNSQLANELQDFLLTDKYKTASGETLTDFDRTILDLKRPENHEKKVKVALLLKTLEKDPTLSSIKKKGITEKADQLFGDVLRQGKKSSVKSSGAKPSSWFINNEH